MSSVFKGIKKVFKKVTSSVGKILPAILGVGAIVFTAGAALGLPMMAGGWGGAVSGVFGSGSTISNVLSGAVTQAGYGAAMGGAGSMLTGGDFSDGAATGALVGGVAGGAMGGLGMGTDPIGNMLGTSQAPTGAAPTGVTAPTGSPVTTGAPGATAAPAANAALNPATAGVPTTGTAPVPGVVSQAPASAGSGFGSWLERNQTLVGHSISGLGGGLLQGLGAKEAAEAEEREAQRIRDSYNVSDDALIKEWKGDPTARPTPAVAYGGYQGGKRRYAYDPKAKRISAVQA